MATTRGGVRSPTRRRGSTMFSPLSPRMLDPGFEAYKEAFRRACGAPEVPSVRAKIADLHALRQHWSAATPPDRSDAGQVQTCIDLLEHMQSAARSHVSAMGEDAKGKVVREITALKVAILEMLARGMDSPAFVQAATATVPSPLLQRAERLRAEGALVLREAMGRPE